ncbi:helix-turn-helix domain-containing protein [Virgibacillus halodenitrificans]|uniref:helix-turn-helix domain-containing protein n=1 Tax=Virgibacillus halodenitrificans TaxID=1482 RepID=UPI00137159FD|nr:helix-turn-helix transcriptional regulator [Virgibacillus halodenitrificans]MYL47666.1 helix-turn-helix domain-containing protein [Virgibacillus halodenitrificans]
MITLKSKNIFNRKIIKQGFSKRGFARANNIAEATLIQISNGKQAPRPETARKICEGLQVEFDDIFLIVEENPELVQ